MAKRGRLLTAILLGVTGCESLRGPATPPEPSAVAAAAPTGAPRRPAKHWLRVGQYVIHSDTQLNANDPVFRDLAELPEQIQTELELPAGESMVQVFLFDSSDKYDEYMKSKYPRLPKRRAYFFAEHRLGGGGDDLLVFTWPSEHLAKDLRHELTHATLHSILKGVPLWLDEGLAGFFELPRATQGVNAGHLDVLRRGPFLPDLARLEKLGQVQQMETPEYREAWAWVHFLLRGDAAGRKVLLDYMQQLRTNATPGPLQPKLCEALANPNQSLAEHLTKTEYPAMSANR
ncbi:hypothetical protein BH11PLA2_BH11PLA2_29510 [soil metagenome]